MVPKQTEAELGVGAEPDPSGADSRYFAFSGRDSAGRFVVLIFFAYASMFFLRSWRFLFYSIVVFLAIVAGLRFSILVEPGRVLIVKKWFFIPYWIWRAAEIEYVEYSDDWGREGEYMGVTVRLGEKEVIIGSVKTMHQLHSALLPWTRAFRERNADPG